MQTIIADFLQLHLHPVIQCKHPHLLRNNLPFVLHVACQCFLPCCKQCQSPNMTVAVGNFGTPINLT